MITVGFQNDLYTGGGDFGEELPHVCLAGWVEMNLRVLNQQQAVLIGRQRRDDYWKHLRHPEAGMDGM